MSKIDLASLNARVMNEREMSRINGGRDQWSCTCSCYYENDGGSSTHDNANANAHYRGGEDSKNGTPKEIIAVYRPNCDPRP